MIYRPPIYRPPLDPHQTGFCRPWSKKHFLPTFFLKKIRCLPGGSYSPGVYKIPRVKQRISSNNVGKHCSFLTGTAESLFSLASSEPVFFWLTTRIWIPFPFGSRSEPLPPCVVQSSATAGGGSVKVPCGQGVAVSSNLLPRTRLHVKVGDPSPRVGGGGWVCRPDPHSSLGGGGNPPRPAEGRNFRSG